MPGKRLALVVANTYAGLTDVTMHLPNAEHDALVMAGTLRGFGFQLVGGRPLLRARSDELRQALASFYGTMRTDNPETGVFFFGGHALENSRDNRIYLLGEEQSPADVADFDAKGVDLITIIDALKRDPKESQQISLVIMDACRRRAGGEAPNRHVISASDQIRNSLQTAPNRCVVLSTKSGQVAYDGSGAHSIFIAAARNVAERTVPGDSVVEYFSDVAQEVAETTKSAHARQEPEVFHHHFTNPPLMATYRAELAEAYDEESKMPDVDQKEAALLKARQDLKTTIEQVRKRNNGIQFIVYSIHHKSWEYPQPTEFLAEDHNVSPPKNLLGDASGNVRDTAEARSTLIYEQIRKGEGSASAGHDFIQCDQIPGPFGKKILYRWRCEPGKLFIFLAGGVGPVEKAEQFQDFSSKELDAQKGELSQAVTKYATAFAEYYK